MKFSHTVAFIRLKWVKFSRKTLSGIVLTHSNESVLRIGIVRIRTLLA
jgi:hypothetical protein